MALGWAARQRERLNSHPTGKDVLTGPQTDHAAGGAGRAD